MNGLADRDASGGLFEGVGAEANGLACEVLEDGHVHRAVDLAQHHER